MDSYKPSQQYQNNQTNQTNQQYYYHKKGYRRGNGGSKNYRHNNYRGGQNQGQKQSYQQRNQYRPQQYPREMVNPYLIQEMFYRTEMYIFTNYNNLLDINTKAKGLGASLTEASSFYVIKSFSEEDVHKSIKYGVWSSSKNGNTTLSNSFKLAKEKGGNVYLFFSCNGSGRFIGVARMKTECDNERHFQYWTQDEKWPGLFEVEWVIIKDVPFREFKNIIITMKDGETKPISNSRDVQEIPFSFAKTMIEIFENYQNSNSILEHFEYYDIRQENYEKQLKLMEAQKKEQNLPKEEEKKESEKEKKEGE